MGYELIEDSTILSTTKQLTDLIPNWSVLVANRISKEPHWKIYSHKPCTKAIVDNIGRAKVASQLHRRLFIKVASDLLEPTLKEQKEVTKIAKKIQNK